MYHFLREDYWRVLKYTLNTLYHVRLRIGYTHTHMVKLTYPVLPTLSPGYPLRNATVTAEEHPSGCRCYHKRTMLPGQFLSLMMSDWNFPDIWQSRSSGTTGWKNSSRDHIIVEQRKSYRMVGIGPLEPKCTTFCVSTIDKCLWIACTKTATAELKDVSRL